MCFDRNDRLLDSAADFAREWADAAYEKVETQSFYNEFFEIFGIRRRTDVRSGRAVRQCATGCGCPYTIRRDVSAETRILWGQAHPGEVHGLLVCHDRVCRLREYRVRTDAVRPPAARAPIGQHRRRPTILTMMACMGGRP